MLLPKKIKAGNHAGGFASGLAENPHFPAGLVLCQSNSSWFWGEQCKASRWERKFSLSVGWNGFPCSIGAYLELSKQGFKHS